MNKEKGSKNKSKKVGSKQSQPLRLEHWGYCSLITSRCANSRLWFVNNSYFEERVLGYVGKYNNHYNVKMYAMNIQGNHYHQVADFNNSVRSGYYRDLNARIAEAVRYTVPEFEGGALFERRYAEQALPLDIDVEDMFFYCALQPVNAGLCEDAKDYPGYNSFWDAISGIEREVKVVDGTAYNKARNRSKKDVSIEDYTTTFYLKYARLPGYEKLSQEEYRDLMLKKYEERRSKIVAKLKTAGHKFPPIASLRNVKRGSKPKETKKSRRDSYRPLVISRSSKARKDVLDRYFKIREDFKIAAEKYKNGDLTVEFPSGTYRPPLFSLVP